VATEPIWTQKLEEKSLASAGDPTSIVRSSSPYPDTILTEPLRLHFVDVFILIIGMAMVLIKAYRI
jgi:hypothetical protein